MVVGLLGFGWYRWTDGQVFAPLRGWERFKFAGDSMLPTMHDGDIFFVESLSVSEVASLHPGDIVVIIDRERNNRGIAKRIAGMAGDTVEARDGLLYRNGEPAPEFADLTAQNRLDDFEPVEVPDGHLFVLGDNFQGSMDSRSIGPFAYQDVLGKVHR